MDTANRYVLVRVDDFSDYRVVDYWKMMKERKLINKRLAGTQNPSLKDVAEMIADKSNICFIIWDEKEHTICADTMLNNFSGLSAQVHFSISPAYHGKEAVNICVAGAEQQFNLIHNVTGRRITTLMGITPSNNRLALKLIKKVGFKVIDEIENLFYIDGRYVNGWISKLYVEDLYGKERRRKRHSSPELRSSRDQAIEC